MKQLSTHAAAAKMIRAHLKSIGIKGSVTSDCFAGGNSVDIDVQDLPPAKAKELEAYCDQFQYGHFDGMIDCYEYSNRREDIPQVKYVKFSNKMSAEMRQKVWDHVRSYWSGMEGAPADANEAGRFYVENHQAWGSTMIHRAFNGCEANFWN